MSRGRKAIIALSSVILAAGVALGGGQAATAASAPTTSSGDLGTSYDAPSQERSMARAAAPYAFNAFYRIANGKNTINVNMTDITGGQNISVSVTNLRLQRYESGKGWRTNKTVLDYDGWHATADYASATVTCKAGALYRGVYAVKYRGDSSGNGTVTTGTWRCPR